MKIAVVGDSHGNGKKLIDLCDVFNECDALFFLGDGERDLTELKGFINVPIYAVSGNNDFGSLLPKESVAQVGGMKFFLTHGHLYGVDRDLLRLTLRAKSEQCDAVFFGHTHIPTVKYNDILVMNPGSLTYPRTGKPSYGIAEGDKNGLFGKIIYI